MSFRKTIKNKFGVDLPIQGGCGTSIESPIIIDISQKYNYVSLEKICINYACQIDGEKWVMEKQELIDHEGKWIDVITIGISTNEVFEENYKQAFFYFDISDCINYSLTKADFNQLW
jgi:hypothetical protein